MDIQLPGKTGLEATLEIREVERASNIGVFAGSPVLEGVSPSSTPASAPTSGLSSPKNLPVIIVALTASSAEEDKVAMLAAGANDFLTKPVSLTWLKQKVLEWGSMQLLAGFSTRRRGTTESGGSFSPLSRNVSWNTVARNAAGTNFKEDSEAQARGVASRLHIEPRWGLKPTPTTFQDRLSERQRSPEVPMVLVRSATPRMSTSSTSAPSSPPLGTETSGEQRSVADVLAEGDRILNQERSLDHSLTQVCCPVPLRLSALTGRNRCFCRRRQWLAKRENFRQEIIVIEGGCRIVPH